MSHREEPGICSIKSDAWKLSDAMLARMDETTVKSKKISTGGKNSQQHCSAFKVHNEI